MLALAVQERRKEVLTTEYCEPRLGEAHGRCQLNKNFLGCLSRQMEKLPVGTTGFQYKLAGVAEAVGLLVSKVAAD